MRPWMMVLLGPLLLLAVGFGLLGGCGEPTPGLADCQTVSECPHQHVCVNGTCQRQSCPSCVEGEVCVGDLCLPSSCGGDRPCRSGEGCLNDRCVDAQCAHVACPENEACAQGRCLPLDCDEQRCNDGVCWDQRCVSARCVDVVCGAQETCAQGVCVPTGCVGVRCSAQAACVEGRCQEVACVGIICRSGTRCAQGRCFPESCPSGPCSEGEVCHHEGCVDPGCIEASCAEGHRCVNSACVISECTVGQDEGCDDADPCTTDRCDAARGCVNERAEDGTRCGPGKSCWAGGCGAATTFCEIDGVVHPIGTTNPAEPCERCLPTKNPLAWSVEIDGVECGAGRVCNAGVCSSGCHIAGGYFAEGTVNPGNPCEQCTPATSTTAWSARPAGAGCGGGKVCSGGRCTDGCWIGGAFRLSGAVNPSNACQQCTPAASTTAWSNKASGTGCGTGQVCHGSTCSAGCWIGGVYRASGAVNPANACQQCTPSSSTTAWSNKSGGTNCGSGQVCNGSTCSAGCWIGGAFRASGSTNPGNACQQCTPKTSTTAWTNKAGGTSCGSGSVCNGSTCSSGCWIGGSFRANDSANPSNACQYCSSSTSTTAWQTRANGTSCSGGQCCSGTCRAKNHLNNCGACGVDCTKTGGSCGPLPSGGYSCSCSTNLQCNNANPNNPATCWLSIHSPPGHNRCQCQSPGSACGDGGKCVYGGSGGNYCAH